MTVFCTYCGEGWPRDPALEVTCPSCSRGGGGRRCVRPSGHEGEIHADRDRRAMDERAIAPLPGPVPRGRTREDEPAQGRTAFRGENEYDDGR